MVDKSKKGKKASISEEGIAALLQRYSVSTVLALLQEVAQVAGEKIGWDNVVKNTVTGISGAREYQMLWRHIAYGETLTDHLDDDANPLDDDSDLEYELEAVPAVGREALAEAAACVKVLIASSCSNDPHLPNNSTIEAPLTINIPSSRALDAPSDCSILSNSMQGTNISIPVSVQKQPLSSGICGEKRPNNGASGVDMGPKRKRRGWSTEEDTKLTAAVQKYGERNWASIARGDFQNDRKPSELSQRWASLRKKQGNANTGTNSQLSETQLAAAHRAMSLALNMPLGGDNLKTAGQMSTDQQFGRVGPPRSQVPTLRPPMNFISTPDSMVKAAAVAAGARIATSADASSLIEAARSQNAVHITTGGSSAIKSSPPGISSQLPSNVHFIRNGLAKAPISTYTAAKPNITQPVEAQKAQGRVLKPTAPAVQPSLVGTSPVTNVTSGVENARAPILSATAHLKVAEDAVASTSANETKEMIQGTDLAEIRRFAPVDHQQVPGNQPANPPKENAPVHQPSIPIPGQTNQTQDDQMAVPCSREGKGEKTPEDQCASKEINQDPISGGGHEDEGVSMEMKSEE